MQVCKGFRPLGDKGNLNFTNSLPLSFPIVFDSDSAAANLEEYKGGQF